MSFETLQFDLADAVATITLNRPNDANALNLQMATELHECSVRCAYDAKVRAVIITGTGKMFCAGGDINDMHAQGDQMPAHLTRMATQLHAAIARFTHMNAPVIMALNGTAAGGGFSFAISGDYVMASEKAKLVSAYTASAFTPDGSATYFLAKHVGLLRAKELLLTNRVLTAQEALEWGLVNRVVSPEELMPEAQKLAKTFAEGPTKAYGGVKALLTSAYAAEIETQLERESRSISNMVGTRDGRHGVESFLNKVKPTFTGE